MAVVRHGRHIEQHVALRHVGVAVGDERLDQAAHLRNRLRRPRLHRRRQHAERGDILVELLRRLQRQLADGIRRRQLRIALHGPRIDLVVDVGDVAGVGDVPGLIDVPQHPEQHVEHDDGPRVADVGEIVDRRSAHVHPHVGRIDGPERLFPARQRVVERERHVTPAASGPLAGRARHLSSGTGAAARQPCPGSSPGSLQ